MKNQISEFKKTTFAILKMQWEFNKKIVLREIFLQVFNKMAFFAEVFCAGRILDIITNGTTDNFHTILFLVAIIISSKLLFEAFQYFSNFKRNIEEYESNEILRKECLEKIARIKMDYFESNKFYRDNFDISSFSSGDIYLLFSESISVPSKLIDIIIALVALMSISPIVSAIFIIIYIPICLIEQKIH